MMTKEKKKKKVKNTTVGFYALGCPKNIIDSERMLAEIAQAGFIIASEPENADVVVINTCGFIEPAKQEALEVIRHALDCKREGTVKKVIVAGCLPQRLGQKLAGEIKGIDAIISLAYRDNISQIIRKTLNTDKPLLKLTDPPASVSDDRTRLLITPIHSPYLRIGDGCDYRCSFCTIPAIRGRFRSKPLELILAEAKELVSAGAVELNIIAQDTTSYGRDLKMKNGLATLIKELEKIKRLCWIRLMYLYPAGITDNLIKTIAESPKTVHYLDIPIQHINNQILKNMHRPDTKEQIYGLIEKLRSAIPDTALRSTLIIGFPGETDKQFNELLEFVEWAEFDALGSFKYYCEADTPAAQMPNQLPDDVKEHRLKELMLRQQEIAFAKNKKRIASELTCLVDSIDEGGSTSGRFYGQAPDIDSICIIENCSAKPGDFVNTRVVDVKYYDLIVEQI
ncbi:30S ribosomal protein S12 methylthiotransferase RimO [Planctomycetota bacterium]